MLICPHCKKEIEPVEETNSKVTTVKDKKGRMKTWTEETRDIDGILLSKRVDGYTYFTDSGAVDIILLKVYDGEETLLSEKEVKHQNASLDSSKLNIKL